MTSRLDGQSPLVASTRGDLYSEGKPGASLDHQESYLKGFFGFLGITDIRFIRAEGLGMGPDAKAAAVAAALTEIKSLAA